MIIIQLPQGYYRNLGGMPKDEALAMFAKNDADFIERNPQCKPFHQQTWREFEAKDTDRAPWGHEWFVVDEAGLLRMHSAHYDSSG